MDFALLARAGINQIPIVSPHDMAGRQVHALDLRVDRDTAGGSKQEGRGPAAALRLSSRVMSAFDPLQTLGRRATIERMTPPPSDQRLMRHYANAAIALTLALVLLPISGLASRDDLAVGLVAAFTLYVARLALQLRQAKNPSTILFVVASGSFAVFMLSVAIGTRFGTPGTGNFFFPSVGLVAGLITVCANVILYMKAHRRAGT